MSNELKHGSVGTQLTQAEWEAIGAHVLDSQAIGDLIYASSVSQLRRLGIGAANAVLQVVAGIPSWVASPIISTPTITGVVTRATYVKEAVFRKNNMADNTATSFFRIATTNEVGNADSGTYSVLIDLEVHAGNAGGGGTTTNVYSGLYKFVRAVSNVGVGANSAVTAISTTGPVGSGGGTDTIASVTVTVIETSEYLVDVQVTIDYSNTSPNEAHATAFVRLIYNGFLTPPVMSQL